jgi:hypothetical protein
MSACRAVYYRIVSLQVTEIGNEAMVVGLQGPSLALSSVLHNLSFSPFCCDVQRWVNAGFSGESINVEASERLAAVRGRDAWFDLMGRETIAQRPSIFIPVGRVPGPIVEEGYDAGVLKEALVFSLAQAKEMRVRHAINTFCVNRVPIHLGRISLVSHPERTKPAQAAASGGWWPGSAIASPALSTEPVACACDAAEHRLGAHDEQSSRANRPEVETPVDQLGLESRSCDM